MGRGEESREDTRGERKRGVRDGGDKEREETSGGEK